MPEDFAARVALPPPPSPTPPPPPAYPEAVTSLRLRRSIVVRSAPAEEAKPIGTIAQDTRVGWRSWSIGPGCPRWIEIAPRGWICERYLEESDQLPRAVELPKLVDGALLPATYARVNGRKGQEGPAIHATPEAATTGVRPLGRALGLAKVRILDEAESGGRRFARTDDGWIESRALTRLNPSTFAGVRLDLPGAPRLPIAWGRKAVRAGARTAVGHRLLAMITELAADGTRALLDNGASVPRGELHVAQAVAPPAAVLPGERWLDVDLDEQVVVAYEGRQPVFATLLSSGAAETPTLPGLYRMRIKFAETDMNGSLGDEESYRVASVPWTMFFAPDLGFHTAYWHDDFGTPRSHGCLNLSPADARHLYFWAAPEVPPGWSMAHGTVESPGSLVRVRSRAVPEPELQGYARIVDEQRRGAADAARVAAPPAPPAPPAPR